MPITISFALYMRSITACPVGSFVGAIRRKLVIALYWIKKRNLCLELQEAHGVGMKKNGGIHIMNKGREIAVSIVRNAWESIKEEIEKHNCGSTEYNFAKALFMRSLKHLEDQDYKPYHPEKEDIDG